MLGMLYRLAICLALCKLACGADSWDLLKSLRPGDAIRVMDASGNRTGRFVKWSAEAITMEKGKSEVALERAQVERVQVKSGARRARNAAIGGAIGLALGVLADQTLGRYARNETGETTGARVATVMAPAGLFAGIAALTSGWRTVYRR